MDTTTAARHGYNSDAEEEDATEEEFALADSHGPVLGELEQAYAEMQSQFAGDDAEPMAHADRMVELSESRRLSEDSLDGNNSSSNSNSNDGSSSRTNDSSIRALVEIEDCNIHSSALPHSASLNLSTSPEEPIEGSAKRGEGELSQTVPTGSPITTATSVENAADEPIRASPSVDAKSPLPHSIPAEALSPKAVVSPAAEGSVGSPNAGATAASPAAKAAAESPAGKLGSKQVSPAGVALKSPSGGTPRRSPYAAHVKYSGRRGRASPTTQPLENSSKSKSNSSKSSGGDLDMDLLARAKAVVAAAAEMGDALSGVTPSIEPPSSETTGTGAAPAAKAQVTPSKPKAVSPVRSAVVRKSPVVTSAGKKSARASPVSASRKWKQGTDDDEDDGTGIDNDLLARARAMCAAANSIGGSEVNTNVNDTTNAAASVSSTIPNENAISSPVQDETAAGAAPASYEADPNWVRLPGTVAVIAGSSLLTTSTDWRPSLLSARGGPLRIWVDNAATSGANGAHGAAAAAESDTGCNANGQPSYVVVQLAAVSSKGEWSERTVALSSDWPGPTCMVGVAERPASGGPKKKKKTQNPGLSQSTTAKIGAAQAASLAEAAVEGMTAVTGEEGNVEGRNLAQRRALSRLRHQRGGGRGAEERKQSTEGAGSASASDTTDVPSTAEEEEEEEGRNSAHEGSTGDGVDSGDGEADNHNVESEGGTDGDGPSAHAHPEPGAVRRRRLPRDRKLYGEETSRNNEGHSSCTSNGKLPLNKNKRQGKSAPGIEGVEDEESGLGSNGDASTTIVAAREAALKRARERQNTEKAVQEAAALTAHAEELLKKAATAQQVERLRDATARRLAEKAKKKRAEAAAEAARATREAEGKAMAAAAEVASANEREALLRAARRETAARRARQAQAASEAVSNEEARRLEALAEHREGVAKAQGNLAAGFGHAPAPLQHSPPHKATAAAATAAVTSAANDNGSDGIEQYTSPRVLYLKQQQQQQLQSVDEENNPPYNLQGTVAVQYGNDGEYHNESYTAADVGVNPPLVGPVVNVNGSVDEGSSRTCKRSKPKSTKKASMAWRTRAPVPLSKAYVSVAAAEDDILTRDGSRRPITPPSEASAAAIARRREARSKQQPLFGGTPAAAAHGGYGFGISSSSMGRASAFDSASVHGGGSAPSSSAYSSDVLPEPDPTAPLASPPKPPTSDHAVHQQQQHQSHNSARTTPRINRRGSGNGNNQSGKTSNSNTRNGYANNSTDALTGGAAIRARARADLILEAEAAKAAQFDGKLLENSALMQGYRQRPS